MDKYEEHKKIEYIDFNIFEGKPTEESFQTITILTFQELFSRLGKMYNALNKREIHCKRGVLVLEQENIDEEKEIFRQTFSFKLKDRTSKILDVVWNHGTMKEVNSDVKFYPGSDNPYKDLSYIMESLGEVKKAKIDLYVAFGTLVNYVIDFVMRKHAEHLSRQ